jgi:hypothetical protein
MSDMLDSLPPMLQRTARLFFDASRWDPAVALGTVAVLSILCLWMLPRWQTRRLNGLGPKERFDGVNEARRTLAQILGGVALLIGLYSTLQNFNLARESLAVARQGQITDRFTKAIEQLGAIDVSGGKRLAVRLGGIYALERIADESERDRWSIVAILSAYVRENSPRRLHEPPRSAGEMHPAADTQAILTVLGRREPTCEYSKLIDLDRTDLRGAFLLAAKLLCADLTDSNLSQADLTAADLRGAQLRRSDLQRTDLRGANFYGEIGAEELRELHWGGGVTWTFPAAQ